MNLAHLLQTLSIATRPLITKQQEGLRVATAFFKKATTRVVKITPPSFGLHSSSKKSTLTILRPGSQAGEWQLWKTVSKNSSSLQEEPSPSDAELAFSLIEEATPPPTSSSKPNFIVGVPTRDLVVIPLWVASEGDLQELVMLELSSKHLLRRGMAEGLKIITLEVHEERTLVIVLAPTTTPSVATTPYLQQAKHFETAARLLPIDNTDLVLWRELGEICLGFVKNNQCVWFSGSSETAVNPFLLGLIKRMTLHLQAESVLKNMPRSMRLIGTFSIEERSLLHEGLGIPESSCEYLPTLPAPLIPKPLLDLPAEQARIERTLQEKQNRIKKIGMMALLGYFFFVALGVGNLLIKELIFRNLSHQFSAASTSIEKANHDLAEWQEFRFAIDPTTYALDLLAAIASQIHGEKIRLISLTDIDGRLQITGEASDVSQAYHFLELIKTAPELQEYEWTSGQPKLAGKNSVRFETEGSLPHAKISSE